MNTAAINQINNKLKIIPDNFVDEIMVYLEFIQFKNSNDEFTLTEEQIKLLESRSKSPIENCISAEDLTINLKSKFSV